MFDYNSLTPETAGTLRTNADQIRALVKVGKAVILEIGQLLLASKALLPHGQFQAWVETEFTERLGWGLGTAENWMRVAENPKVCDFPLTPSALYILAGAPDDAIETIEGMIEQGPVTVKQVAATVTESRFRQRVEQSMSAMCQARPSEVETRHRGALDLLRELNQAMQDDRLTRVAVEMMKRHGDKLRGWAEVLDTKDEIMAAAGVTWDERREPEPLQAVTAELVEGEGNHSLVVWVPVGENVSRPFTIARFESIDLDLPGAGVALAWQCSVLDVACKRVNARLP